MKVLMLTWEFPPRIVGGIATHVFDLSRALAAQGVSVHVLTCDFPNAPAEEIIDGVRVTRVDAGRFPQSSFLLWIYHLNSKLVECAEALLKTEHYDLVHAHDWLVGRAALELKARHDLPLVTTIHATEMGRGGALDNEYRTKVHVAERLLAKSSERVICCSQYMVRHLKETLSIPADAIDVIHNAVDVARFRTNGQPNPFEDGRTILFVGRLVNEKGVQTLLKAFSILRRNGSDASLVVVGDGPMKTDFTRDALSLGLDGSVRFTGFTDPAVLISMYRSSDVVVVPSLYEPFGIVALEAMAARTPVIVSDVGGLAEIVEDGQTGLKVPPGDPDVLALALDTVLHDPGYADKLRQNAYRVVGTRFTWDGVAAKTRTVYRMAVAQPRVPAAPLTEDAFLDDVSLIQFLLAVGATKSDAGLTSKEIASKVAAPNERVKLVLGWLVSDGYVSTAAAAGPAVRYHLSETGIIKACRGLS